MLETRAIVVQVDGADALVEVLQGGGCGHCSGGACGSSTLSGLFCVRPRRFRARNDVNARVGEEVRISVADGTLLRNALVLYGLPLLLLLAGGASGMYWPGGDAASAVGASIGLAGGVLLAGFIARRSKTNWTEPIIIRGAE